MTPNGQFLAFTSTADLTAGDTSTAAQAFEYDAETGSLVRVSIGQGGFNDNGNTSGANTDTGFYNAEFPEKLWVDTQAIKPYAVSDDGSYVVFQSARVDAGGIEGIVGRRRRAGIL